MAQPTFDGVTADAGTGGSDFVTDTITAISQELPFTGVAYSTGNGSFDAVTDSGTEGLPVRLDNSQTIAVTNAGTFLTQINGPALTALQIIDNPVFVEDVAFSGGSVMMSGAIRDDTLSGLTPAEGDAVPLRVGSTGALHVTGGGGGTEYTEDVGAASPPVGTALILVREDARAGGLTSTDGDNVALRGNDFGEAYVIDTDAVALLTTIDADTSTIAGDTTSIDGKITACDTGAVVVASGTITAVTDITNTVTVDNGGTFAVQDADAITALQIIDNPVLVEDVAFSGGSVMMAGAIRDNTLSALTPAEGDAVPLRVGTTGALHTVDGDDVLTHFGVAEGRRNRHIRDPRERRRTDGAAADRRHRSYR